MSAETFFPKEMNLGKSCSFWNTAKGECDYPTAEMKGRRSCLGKIDDVCLFLRTGRDAKSLTADKKEVLRTRIPSRESNRRTIPKGKFL